MFLCIRVLTLLGYFTYLIEFERLFVLYVDECLEGPRKESVFLLKRHGNIGLIWFVRCQSIFSKNFAQRERKGPEIDCICW